MAADIHFSMWRDSGEMYHFNQAEKIYIKLINAYPKSPLAERTKLLLAYAQLEKSSSLNSIQNLNQFIDAYPKSKSVDRAQFAVAENFLRLNKLDTAKNIYQKLKQSALHETSKIEAEYREGDVYFLKTEYKKAIGAYKKAIKQNKSFEATFANAHYNIGESYFWLGDYKNALKHYVNFVELFPSHKHNAFALTRIGETLEILGADKKQYMGAFIESYFRFEKSEGSQVARLRVLSKQMKSMRKKELDKSLKQMKIIAKNSHLPKIEEFVTLLITDGYRTRQNYDKALAQLVQYYQKNPTSANLVFFKKRIVGNIADSINDKITKKDFIAAFKIFDKYSNTWLKNIDRLDTQYYLGKAYELAGVYDSANDIYKKLYTKIKKVEGTKKQLKYKVNQQLPSSQQLELRIAHVALNQTNYSEAYNYLTKIKNTKSFTPEELIERVQIASQVYEKKQDYKRAVKYLSQLIKQWQGNENLLISTHIRLAEVQMKQSKYVNAEFSAEEALDLIYSMAEKDDELLKKSLKLKADAIYNQGRKVASVEVYLDLLSRFDGSSPGVGYIRHKAGEIIFNTGDVKAAEKIWHPLGKNKNQLYWQLASEKLENAKWQDSYSKYIERIPAMKRK